MKRVHVVFAVSLALAVFAGMYAAASTSAASIVASFSTTEATNHKQIVAFGATLRQAAADHRAARAKCKTLTRSRREACNNAVIEQDKHAFDTHTW